jgi:hypothetical protein
MVKVLLVNMQLWSPVFLSRAVLVKSFAMHIHETNLKKTRYVRSYFFCG